MVPSPTEPRRASDVPLVGIRRDLNAMVDLLFALPDRTEGAFTAPPLDEAIVLDVPSSALPVADVF